MADLPDCRDCGEGTQKENQLHSKREYDEVGCGCLESSVRGVADSKELERHEAIELDKEEETSNQGLLTHEKEERLPPSPTEASSVV